MDDIAAEVPCGHSLPHVIKKWFGHPKKIGKFHGFDMY
jgi:hypothetical protein